MRSLRRVVGLVGLLAAMAAGCDSSPTDVTRPIGATGGTVMNSDGTSVVVPPGALGATATISITPITAPAPAGTVLVGPAYDFAPDGTTFAQPVSITLPFDATKIPAGRTANDIRIYTAARGSTQYTALQTSLSTNTVQTFTTHFTVYLPAAPAAVTSGDGDMGITSVHDLATASGSDLTSNPCTIASPTCGPQSGGCGCSATCGGHTYSMICFQQTTSAPLMCNCLLDGSVLSGMSVAAPTSCSTIESVFGQCDSSAGG